MPGSTAQDEWVQRVLAVALPRRGMPDPTALAAAAAKPIVLPAKRRPAEPPIRFVSVEGLEIWRRALDAVGAQFAGLRDAMTGTDDENLNQIAAVGWSALRERLGDRIDTALILADRDGAAGRNAALKVLDDYRALLANDGLVQELERNPLGVPVAIRATLGAALDRIEPALRG